MSDATWQFEVFYDGECPLCEKEIRMLRWLDRKDRIRFTDIAANGFDPAAIQTDMETLMNSIRGRDRDGKWYAGVDVFRRLYESVGFGPVVKASRLPGISHGLKLGYRWFAKNRLKLTGRCTKETCSVSS